MPQDVLIELVSAKVARVDRQWESTIEVRDGKSLPFLVERSWSGPAGHYIEQWSLRRGMREVVYKSQPNSVFVRGIQSLTTHTDRVEEAIPLEPGSYRLVFVVEGHFMGSVEVEVVSTGSAAA